MPPALIEPLPSWDYPTYVQAKSVSLAKDAEPQTLIQLLQRAATRWPNNSISFKDKGWDQEAETLTYADIFREVMFNAAKLRAGGIVTSQKCIVLYFNTHRANTIWYWSVVAAGGIPALLSPLSNNATTLTGELDNVNKLFQGPTILTSKQLSGTFKLIPGFKTTTIQQVAIIPNTPVQEENAANSDALATLLFTSGSTGYAKAVEYTHEQLICSSKLKSKFHRMDSSKTFMSWISFDHSAALCEIHLQALYAGANQVMIPAIDFVRQPLRFWAALSEHKVAYTFSPNFFLAAASRAMNEQSGKHEYDFSNLRVIMCGGEANRTSTLAMTEEVLVRYNAPPRSIKSSYGLSETCSAFFYNLESPTYDVEHGYVFASVGKHLPQHSLRIVDEERNHVPQGSSGAIQVRGPLILKRYFNNKAATDACMTPDGWFDTGDLGLLDPAGNLRIVGRSKEVLIINGQNYSSFELEHAIESTKIAGLTPSYIASFSIWDDNVEADSEDIVILLNPRDDVVQDSPELRDTISQINEAAIRFCRKSPAVIIPLPKEKMPKSTIGKLSRAKLKKAYQAGQFDEFKLPEALPVDESAESKGSELITPLQKTIGTVFAAETGVELSDLRLDTVISRLGIDSLGYLRIKSSLEKALDAEDPMPMTELLACHTIRDLDFMLLTLGTTTPKYDPIVPLVTTGSKNPLILCHPGGGEFLTWLGLLPYIPDRRVLALRVRGFHKSETPFETIDEMLDIYVEGIKKHQPEGPYALLGLCFGGLLAFELGKRLEVNGDEVRFIAGIDNPADLRRIQVREKSRNFFIDLLHFFQILSMEEALRWEEEMNDIPDDEFTSEIFARFPDGTLESMGLTHAKVETWSRINNNMQNITKSYEPQGKVSKFDIFWVPPLPQYNCSDEQWRYNWLAGWKNHVAGSTQADIDVEDSEGPLRYHRVEGSHFTILRPENIEVFQKALNTALELRGC
ncbi:uncharacterized protein K452DRAFT_258153 [Aplosporella prunicola CBS 121167]|uniref:Carrier domain-containing protein n=1 Tax=Aplosporella prunicola CBS 121167 TaxID=1176127 RepID=A0A6A6AZ18_9PEZI|nr:uncharacterized protein K452DRAFT_258153 [Aplosporella prunicola CBS 121167]KAF2137182.1 hypothetical protein K452DRAFT_258153 [Aplosporella prunicola CBS 121167]